MSFVTLIILLKKLTVALSLFILTSCNASSQDHVPLPPAVSSMSPITVREYHVGTTCRAENISGNDGAVRYKSSYFNILSDGSEQVQNVVETESPCP